MAFLAVEMHVEVVVVVVVMTVAELVADSAAGVFKEVDKMGVLEQLEGAEDVAFVRCFPDELSLSRTKGQVLLPW